MYRRKIFILRQLLFAVELHYCTPFHNRVHLVLKCSTVYFVLFQIPMYDCTIKLINLDSEINATLTLSLNLVTEHLKLSVQS